MHPQQLGALAGLMLALVGTEPAAADAGAAVLCDKQGVGASNVDIADRLPLQIDQASRLWNWPGSLRATYIDEHGRYVTVYHDPDWQQRLRLVDCPLR